MRPFTDSELDELLAYGDSGYVHSVETGGTVDGPGLRYVVFTAGCPLRCLYCHNPDSMHRKNGHVMRVPRHAS